MKTKCLPVLALLACTTSLFAQSLFPLPIPQRPSLPLSIPERPMRAGFLYLKSSSSYGASAGSITSFSLFLPSALPPALQGSVVSASVSQDTASTTLNGGWALSADGRIGSLVQPSGGAGGSASPGPIPILAPFTDAVVVAGSSLSTGVVAIKADGTVVGAINTLHMAVPPEASVLRSVDYDAFYGLFYGLNADGQFVAWSYGPQMWPPQPSSPVVATNWTMNKPALVQVGLIVGMYGGRLVGLTEEGEIRSWDEQGAEVVLPQDGNANISLVRLGANTMMQTFAGIRSDGGLFLARLGQSEPLPLPEGIPPSVEIQFLPSFSEVAVALAVDGKVNAWRVDSGQEFDLPEGAAVALDIAADGVLTKPDGSKLQLTYVQSNPMDPASGTIVAVPIDAGVLVSGSHYVLSEDPSLVLGFPLSVLSRIVAEDILAHTNNYGLATKPDLLSAVQQAATAGERQGIAAVQSAPNSFGLYDSTQYEANRMAGVAEGKAEVTSNPTSYNLYTSDSIMDLRMEGAMVPKSNGVASVSIQPTTTTNLMQPFTNSGTPITFEVPMPANRAFMRIEAKTP